MRVIKLSSEDRDFPDRSSVDAYFKTKLPSRDPVGKFLLTKGRIAKGGIAIGETIIFSYKTEITHIAKAASGRIENLSDDRRIYPYYFIVDMKTIHLAKGTIADVEVALSQKGIHKNIVKTQGWPIIDDSYEVEQIYNSLKRKARTI